MKRVRARKEPQHSGAMLPPEQRRGFDLVEATLTEEAALEEAARCMQCSSFCDKCVEVCPNRANYTFNVLPVRLALPRLTCQQGELAVAGEDVFDVAQARQIVHVDDFCNECGNCATFCVHDGKPYLEKPRLFLERRDFERETDNAFYVEASERGWAILRRERGAVSRLHLDGDSGDMVFDNELLTVNLSPDFQVSGMELKHEFEGPFFLAEAAEMAVILKGIITSLPFLPV